MNADIMSSILFNTDSYKVSMWKQYPANTEFVYSYIEARGGPVDHTIWFGLQAFINQYLRRPITQSEIDLADKFWTAHGEPFNREGWEHILRVHRGYLPIRIKQIPEGERVPVKHVLATIENTDPKVPWLTTWVETAALRAAWYGTNVATISFEIKRIIKDYLERSGTPEELGFKLHDFGARGANSLESSGIGGAAHLVNFMGTDNVSGIIHAAQHYGADLFTTGFSIPAAEHSTITSWGREHEKDAYANMLEQFSGPGKIFACVSDSYNIYEAVDMWGAMRDRIVELGGTLVVRPDSGDPVQVLRRLMAMLDRYFGHTQNEKGYKVLNNVRVIWGDGINQASIRSIYGWLVDVEGWSADNFAFGMGGALLQQHDRDTFKFAMKASAAFIDGKWVEVFKDPVTDSGKASKRGRVTTVLGVDGYRNAVQDWEPEALQTVYEDGMLIGLQNFKNVRIRAEKALNAA
ncbi:nicotinamide phosphoribosyl transferase [Acidovorax phage ACP17]|uniref:Nicotinamide phosphoribosyltransferase n=1 Tax=Acidovorax phage ACP17 TaxID=2010329 RepID=A0A218M332_9CAUD|nr:nicotinamide phosphoribosyl transferase [Acidovorax phage ACP17]ASD50456.1 nicotinamide phosphoribosyltransferase [Acidovorax phage ACP17]